MSNKGDTVNAKHTSGPWAAIPSGERGQERAWFVHQKEHAQPVAKTAWFGMPKIESDANARLIAAAPELLAALRDLKHQLHHNGLKLNVRKHYSLLVADAVAGTAIAKAEGR